MNVMPSIVYSGSLHCMPACIAISAAPSHSRVHRALCTARTYVHAAPVVHHRTTILKLVALSTAPPYITISQVLLRRIKCDTYHPTVSAAIPPLDQSSYCTSPLISNDALTPTALPGHCVPCPAQKQRTSSSTTIHLNTSTQVTVQIQQTVATTERRAGNTHHHSQPATSPAADCLHYTWYNPQLSTIHALLSNSAAPSCSCSSLQN
jgi:hypothetical protein